MMPVTFNKAFAERVLDALRTGGPIPAPDGHRWSQSDELALAGILFAAAYSHGPPNLRAQGYDFAAFREMHQERKEAIEDMLRQGLHDSIEFAGNLAFRVIDGEYDDQYEADVAAVLYRTEDGEMALIPARGFKVRDGDSGP